MPSPKVIETIKKISYERIRVCDLDNEKLLIIHAWLSEMRNIADAELFRAAFKAMQDARDEIERRRREGKI